jgi:hypothetical protein
MGGNMVSYLKGRTLHVEELHNLYFSPNTRMNKSRKKR